MALAIDRHGAFYIHLGTSCPSFRNVTLSYSVLVSGIDSYKIMNSVPNGTGPDHEEATGNKRKHCSISRAGQAGPGGGGEANTSASAGGRDNHHHNNHVDGVSLFKSYSNVSSDGKLQLVILRQPEKQHRARYQTEGSRGAVKDRDSSGFPTVQLKCHNASMKNLLANDSLSPPVLQVFVGSDTGTPIPHLYYQACKVSGKNSTPCQELKKENTDVILVDMDAEKDFTVVCDCVGILKERHSDIESKVPATKRVQWKKKQTTKCRLVFRTEVVLENGRPEVLQVASDAISCTQLPGTPEVLKMSLTSCSLAGGEELWMIGKNFLKDTVVIFQEDNGWTKSAKPNKEFFNNTHLIVTIPPYRDPNCAKAVVVNVLLRCGNKTSDPKQLTFKPELSITSPVVTAKMNGVLSVSGGLAANPRQQQILSANRPIAPASAPTPGAANGEPGILYNSTNGTSSSNSRSSRQVILEHIEDNAKQQHDPHISRVSRKKRARERKMPFSRAREQPDLAAEETMFDTVEGSASTPNSSLDRSRQSWTGLFSSAARPASNDRGVGVGVAPAVQSSVAAASKELLAYRQQMPIPDDTCTTTLMENTLTQASTANFGNNMDESSNPAAAATSAPIISAMATETKSVTSPTSHMENLSFGHQQQAQPGAGPAPPAGSEGDSSSLSFAGITKPDFMHRFNEKQQQLLTSTASLVIQQQQQPQPQQQQQQQQQVPVAPQPVLQQQQPQLLETQPQPASAFVPYTNPAAEAPSLVRQEDQQQQQQLVIKPEEPTAPSSSTTAAAAALPSATSQQQQQQTAPQPSGSATQAAPAAGAAPDSKCSLGFDNPGTESATISITLPPSFLHNQEQLSTIVNTISKALHPPQSTSTTNGSGNASSNGNGNGGGASVTEEVKPANLYSPPEQQQQQPAHAFSPPEGQQSHAYTR